MFHNIVERPPKDWSEEEFAQLYDFSEKLHQENSLMIPGQTFECAKQNNIGEF